MVEEKDADAYQYECCKCGHKWEIKRVDLMKFSRVMSGKNPHCPKCGNSKVMGKPTKL